MPVTFTTFTQPTLHLPCNPLPTRQGTARCGHNPNNPNKVPRGADGPLARGAWARDTREAWAWARARGTREAWAWARACGVGQRFEHSAVGLVWRGVVQGGVATLLTVFLSNALHSDRVVGHLITVISAWWVMSSRRHVANAVVMSRMQACMFWGDFFSQKTKKLTPLHMLFIKASCLRTLPHVRSSDITSRQPSFVHALVRPWARSGCLQTCVALAPPPLLPAAIARAEFMQVRMPGSGSGSGSGAWGRGVGMYVSVALEKRARFVLPNVSVCVCGAIRQVTRACACGCACMCVWVCMSACTCVCVCVCACGPCHAGLARAGARYHRRVPPRLGMAPITQPHSITTSQHRNIATSLNIATSSEH
jgi:hypothetical protein